MSNKAGVVKKKARGYAQRIPVISGNGVTITLGEGFSSSEIRFSVSPLFLWNNVLSPLIIILFDSVSATVTGSITPSDVLPLTFMSSWCACCVLGSFE